MPAFPKPSKQRSVRKMNKKKAFIILAAIQVALCIILACSIPIFDTLTSAFGKEYEFEISGLECKVNGFHDTFSLKYHINFDYEPGAYVIIEADENGKAFSPETSSQKPFRSNYVHSYYLDYNYGTTMRYSEPGVYEKAVELCKNVNSGKTKATVRVTIYRGEYQSAALYIEGIPDYEYLGSKMILN